MGSGLAFTRRKLAMKSCPGSTAPGGGGGGGGRGGAALVGGGGRGGIGGVCGRAGVVRGTCGACCCGGANTAALSRRIIIVIFASCSNENGIRRPRCRCWFRKIRSPSPFDIATHQQVYLELQQCLVVCQSSILLRRIADLGQLVMEFQIIVLVVLKKLKIDFRRAQLL